MAGTAERAGEATLEVVVDDAVREVDPHPRAHRAEDHRGHDPHRLAQPPSQPPAHGGADHPEELLHASRVVRRRGLELRWATLVNITTKQSHAEPGDLPEGCSRRPKPASRLTSEWF